MKANGAKGKLVIIGGGEDKEDDCTILKEFIRLGGKAEARIAIMTVATDKPAEYAGEYRKVFKKLGVDERGWLMSRTGRTRATGSLWKLSRLLEDVGAVPVSTMEEPKPVRPGRKANTYPAFAV